MQVKRTVIPMFARRVAAGLLGTVITFDLAIVHVFTGALMASWIVYGDPSISALETRDLAECDAWGMLMAAWMVPVLFVDPLVRRGLRAKLGLPERREKEGRQ